MASEAWLEFLLSRINRGEYLQSLQKLLPSPSSTYPESEHATVIFLENFLDAAAFSTRGDAYLALKDLLSSLESDVMLSVEYEHVTSLLEYDERLLYYSILQEHPFSIETIHPEVPALTSLERLQTPIDLESLLEFVPELYKPLMKARVEMLQRWSRFEWSKPATDLFHMPIPWLPFSYAGKLPFEKGQNAFLIDPYAEGWEEFFDALKNSQALFVFESMTTLVQMFQFPSFVEGLDKEKHTIYLLDRHPSKQFQKPLKLKLKESQELGPDPKSCDSFKSFCDAIASGAGDDEIYEAGLKLRFKIQAHRLGPSRIFPLLQKEGSRQWNDEHKMPSYSEEDLAEAIKKASEGHILKRRSMGEGKKKIAHIVPQVVDGGHAPSRLLESLLKHHDKEQFDLYLFSTEILLHRNGKYPFNLVASESSVVRGKSRLAEFQDLGVNIWIDDGKSPDTAFHVVKLLQEKEIDIAVFHGPDLINLLCSRCCDVPLKVLFEHGTPSSYPAFDLVIFSALATQEKYQELFDKLNIAYEVLPFTVDARLDWAPMPYVRHQMGLPQDGFLMTTISNHLDSRLGDKMCQTIATILQRCPLAYYAPLGNVLHPKRLRKIFFDYGVDDKVFFLGARPNPSQYARSMQLYLNEFPFGSGLGILDAMAAGCPVVTMVDPEGPPQANYGGVYHGFDKAVKKGDIEGYINLACTLYEDRDKHEQWSKEAIVQYDQRINIKEYIKKFEEYLTLKKK